MSARHFSLIAATLALLALPDAAQADSQPQAALAGTVSSAKEGLMEGVVVSAKQVGSTVTVSVATDDKGRFSFPASRLKPGQYAISIRAIGYDLEMTRAVCDATGIPVIASGGVGTLDHLADGALAGGADAVLAASIFHFGQHSIREAKEHLAARGVPVRPA